MSASGLPLDFGGIECGDAAAAQAWAAQLSRADEVTRKLKPIDVHDFLALNIPPREMVLAPWLPTQGLAMIHAARGTGKTNLALAIAYAVASGSELMGWRPLKARKVLYLDGEMLAAPMQERLAGIVKTATATPEPRMLQIITPDFQPGGMPDIATIGGQVSLNEAIPEGTELIIVDSLSSLARGEGRENDAESWLPIAQWTLGQRVLGRSILFLHHSGKNGAQRGTSKREDLLDSVLALRKPADGQHTPHARFEIHVEKSRSLSALGPMLVEMMPQPDGGSTWAWKPLDETNVERIRKMSEDGMSKREIAEELKIARSTVYRILARAGKQ